MTDEVNVVPFDRKKMLDEQREKAHASRRAKVAEVGPKQEGDKSRWQRLLDGDITVQDLDDDELREMRTKSRLGDFTGRPPGALPAKIAHAMRAEWLARAQAGLETALPTAVAALAEIAGNPRVPVKDRITAANLVVERGLGKVAEKVELTQHSADPWEDILQGVVTDDKLERLKEVVDGQVS